jgi:hypothetical protein
LVPDLKDFGEIVLRNGEFRGELTLEQARKAEEGFLTNLAQDFEGNLVVKNNITRLLTSRHLPQRYTEQ